MAAYYNEFDPKVAAWLRELIRCGHIAPGEVDERSIVEVAPEDLRGFAQCHFFAGIGVWSYALQQAGWADERPVWTGSCPCQPFSAAGKRETDRDSRHLAPAWLRLIRECQPSVIFGEQVSAAIRVGWLDALFAEMEQMHYACGAVDFPACSVGAPHIRQRLYFVADRDSSRCGEGRAGEASDGRGTARIEPTGLRDAGEPLDHATDTRRSSARQHGGGSPLLAARSLESVGVVSVADSQHAIRRSLDLDREDGRDGAHSGREEAHSEPGARGQVRELADATNGFWSDAEWLPCRDGKLRPTQPGLLPLAHGIAGRVGLLRGAGNAIVAPQAEAFIRAYLGTLELFPGTDKERQLRRMTK